ncbi:hypothetical protein [Nostoc foliaceum]|uniref:hypothetical protein n=1 Tax=Nostoc foliaceum TaxID=2692914 RepID=UPI001A7E2C4A|nr:hypothetical protein [Nostoc foliaceum]
MLQVVATITFIFLGTAALFEWLQYCPALEETNTQARISYIPVFKHYFCFGASSTYFLHQPPRSLVKLVRSYTTAMVRYIFIT